MITVILPVIDIDLIIDYLHRRDTDLSHTAVESLFLRSLIKTETHITVEEVIILDTRIRKGKEALIQEDPLRRSMTRKLIPDMLKD